MTGGRGAVITGWGTALPDKVVTNADLEARLDTTDAWITERSGIRERRVGGTTTGLATDAGAAALAAAALEPADIDLLILATTTPDQTVPATASAVQDALGLTCGAMDVNAACSGFVYGLVTACGLIGLGAGRILLIGAETLSRITDQDDRGTAVLFADGAGAVVVEAVDGPGSLLGWDLGSDGSLRSILYADVGGYLEMEGREVFRRAVRVTVDSAQAAMQRAGVTADDIALFVPHQANLRIIDAAGQRIGIPSDRTAIVLDRTGNTSSASIPLALADALDHGRVRADDLVLLSGFGAGMTWASAVLRWPETDK
ncbi:MAG: 3-oxoacyl-(acyl-carrier-protein) synthase [Acidimicrobiales bacterium]|jgi:3-oxoacyl-[acyl-carrier-protein] synthase-3|nr:3-oxoacyl-(acyl-carrier-protein) synthase [Acidimicrobiales bacterium]